MKKVVIIGGGFAGLHLARKLSNSKYFSVLLVDKANHHQFQPLFYQVASARLEPANISFPFRKIFQRSRNVSFRLAEAGAISPGESRILTDSGDISYDILVIASGCTTNFFGNSELEANSLTMKSTLEAIDIRNEVLLSFEDYMNAPAEEREAIANFVIVGGGPTGVELAGAFAEMKKNILPRDYPGIDFSEMKIIIAEGGETPLGSMSTQAQQASRKYLDRMGVQLMTKTYVTGYDGHTLKLSTGKELKARNVIWAAGVKGNVIPGIAEAAVNRNRYIVDRYNRVKGYNNVYALGDVAYMETPQYPKGHPQLANVAINQGKNLADNLIAIQKSKPLKEYEYRDLGSMATIGKHKAVVDLPFWKFHGYFAWFIWMFLHLMLILSVRNKIIIFLNWAWHYTTRDSALRLIFKEKKRKTKVVPKTGSLVVGANQQ
jgi:NADH:ubiquinone reductase (H+-translocating)